MEKIMKVKMNTIMCGPEGNFQPGQIAEFEDKKAKDLINGGFAEKYEDPEEAARKAAAAKKKAEQEAARKAAEEAAQKADQEEATTGPAENAATGKAGKK
jgi:4'-phosphopantetheinyl transferase EntD